MRVLLPRKVNACGSTSHGAVLACISGTEAHIEMFMGW
jgi:hypothetical protein